MADVGDHRVPKNIAVRFRREQIGPGFGHLLFREKSVEDRNIDGTQNVPIPHQWKLLSIVGVPGRAGHIRQEVCLGGLDGRFCGLLERPLGDQLRAQAHGTVNRFFQ